MVAKVGVPFLQPPPWPKAGSAPVALGAAVCEMAMVAAVNVVVPGVLYDDR